MPGRAERREYVSVDLSNDELVQRFPAVAFFFDA
jgi:hypothetical protein